MCDHNRDHNGCCDHGDCADESMSIAYSLYQKIDTNNVECLNERIDDTGKLVFKPWSERLNKDVYVESDTDAELLYNIQFIGDVKIKGIIIIASEELSRMKLYKNRLRMSFDDVAQEPDQEFEISHDAEGIVEYFVKPTKFFNVHHLSLHLTNRNTDDNDNPCRIYYIGLKGEFTQVDRNAIVIANYEIRPTAALTDAADKVETSIHPVS